MLKHKLIHPEILQIIGQAGHHSSILIADGNYPAASKKGPNAKLISLNLMPGVVNCSQVLEAILSAVPIEEINTMMYESTGPYALTADPPVWSQYRDIVRKAGLNLDLKPIEKWDFYQAVGSPDHVLTIQTGDQALWANVLLTMGCRTN